MTQENINIIPITVNGDGSITFEALANDGIITFSGTAGVITASHGIDGEHWAEAGSETMAGTTYVMRLEACVVHSALKFTTTGTFTGAVLQWNN